MFVAFVLDPLPPYLAFASTRRCFCSPKNWPGSTASAQGIQHGEVPIGQIAKGLN